MSKFMESPTITHFKDLKRLFHISKVLLILTCSMVILIALNLWVIMIVIGLDIWMIERTLRVLFSTWETQHSHGVQRSNL
jgi:hypothetical protein